MQKDSIRYGRSDQIYHFVHTCVTGQEIIFRRAITRQPIQEDIANDDGQ
jgi:hypothetical protein